MKHILIVEDEPDIQELLRTYLEDAGYQTAVAGDGVVVRPQGWVVPQRRPSWKNQKKGLRHQVLPLRPFMISRI